MTIDEQNAHPLYKDAHERFLRAEQQQNIKAAAKYPEPLNPASWTAEELGDHYAQESVDQGRYVEALVAKCKALEEAIESCLCDLERLDSMVMYSELLEKAIETLKSVLMGAEGR